MNSLFCKPKDLLIKINFLNFFSDARHFQIAYLGSFLISGILFLGWFSDVNRFLLFIATTLSVQLIGIYFTNGKYDSLKSALITSLGLSLLCKTNGYDTAMIASVIAIGSKFLIRFNNKHLFNPVNFGLIGTILLTGDAWISPGQWGSHYIITFVLGIFGFFVLKRVNRLDTSITFLLVFGGLHFYRSVIFLGWELDFFVHQMTSGTLMLFTFFMITDPMTTPNHRTGRIIWTAIISVVAFLLGSKMQVYAAPIWVLFFATPFTPLFDKIFVAEKFEWKLSNTTNTKLQPTII